MKRWGASRSCAAAVAAVGLVLALSGCEELVVEALPVADIEIQPDPVELLELEERSISAVVLGPQGQVLGGRDLSWSVDDASIARLEGSGILVGQGVGQTTLRAATEGVEGAVPVTVRQGPMIQFGEADARLSGLAGDSSPAEIAIGISNSGNGSLTGLTTRRSGVDGAAAPSWLEASVSGAEAPAELIVRALLEDLPAGTYEAEVFVESPVAPNSPARLPIHLDVALPPPVIGLSPASLAFTSSAGSREPASQDVTVTNEGGGELDGLRVDVVYTQGRSGWLSAELGAVNAPTAVALEASARDLSEGVYRAVVRVSAPNASPTSAEIEVTFNVSRED
ncbi:MAG: hypothetical protein EA351_07565 [Gemmatimonadales bacterium]|nr:MAG: hypothetical protein EA351_07565 [Gemmatimonadales bacterium]